MMTKELVNTAIINGLKSKGVNIAEIQLNHLEAFADIMYKAITVIPCCTELPTKMVEINNAYIEDTDDVDGYNVDGRYKQVFVTEKEFNENKCINN